jgi:carboxylesterase
MTSSDLRALVAQWNREEEGRGVPAEHRSFFLSADSDVSPVFVVHGAGGSPADYDVLGRYLRERGRSVLCPLLPGHGLGAQALGEVRFSALVEAVRTAYAAAANGRSIPVIGQSLGAVLTIHLVTQFDVSCFIALAPALRPYVLLRVLLLLPLFVVRPSLARATSRWYLELKRGIESTIPEIERVICPLCVLHSRGDHSVRLAGARLLHDRAGSSYKRLVILQGQGHALARAPDRDAVFTPIVEFLDGVS